MKKFLIVASLLVLAGCQSLQSQMLGGGTEEGTHAYFAYDSAVLSAESQKKLDGQAEWLKKNPKVEVTIEGHADERGTREYNLALGERRADAAKKYLVTMGVAEERVRTVSYGKERPAVLGSTEAAWAKNRRAVTVVE
jgi:peptidoglycan-associated lipoprotein